MRILLAAAATLMVTGSAYAYQTYTTPTDPALTVTVDPTVAFTPPATWTTEQRMLWDQHMAFYPTDWTAEQRAAFEAMMAVPPANWTPEQRALYAAHYAALPANWTAEQRAAYAQQIASLETPWMTTQTAYTTSTTTTTTLAAASPAVIQPSNANPELDARGIPVISDVAYVPPGFNGVGGAMGGPSEGTDETYPPCTRERTDNCIQLYERGVSAQANVSSAGVGGPYEPVDSSATKPLASSTTTTSTTTTGTKPTATESSTATTTDTTHPDMSGTTTDDTTSTTTPKY